MKESVLVRKLAHGQQQAGDRPRSILRGLRLGLARAADDTLGLAISVIGARQSIRSQDELPDVLEDGWLSLVFAASDGQLAAACINPECVASIIQQQTIGQIPDGPVGARAYTGTDAAMAAPLIEQMLARSAELVEAPDDRNCLSGFEYLSRAEDLRGLLLLLEQDVYRLCELTVEIAGGKRQGQIALVLPERPPSPDEEPDDLPPPGRRLEQATGVMRAELDAVIGTLHLPLSALAALKVGDALPLIGSGLDRTELLTIEGQRMALCRLGQCGGMRAVRLNEALPAPVLPDDLDSRFLNHDLARPAATVPPSEAATETETAAVDEALTTLAQPMPGTELAGPLGTDAQAQQRLAADISELAGLTGEDLGAVDERD